MSNILTNNINPRSGNLITIGGSNDRVSIAGTLTYEDVANIDSVGIITAQSGIHVTAGNVGIGTTNPNQRLTVGTGSGPESIVIQSGPGNTGELRFTDTGSSGYQGAIVYNHPDTFLSFHVDSAERMRIDSLGRLLIGTSAHIGVSNVDNRETIQSVENSGSSIILGRDDTTVTNTNTFGGLQFYGNAGGTFQKIGEVLCTAAADQTSSSMATKLTFSTTPEGATSPTERVRIDSSGRLLVGTTSDTRKFVVEQANSTAYNRTDFDQDYHIIKLRNSTDSKSAGIQFSIGSNGEAAITVNEEDSDGSAAMCFGTRGGGTRAERMRIDGSGNLLVGIYEKNPSTDLVEFYSKGANVNQNLLVLNGGTTAFSGTNDANTYQQILFRACAYNTTDGITVQDAAAIRFQKVNSWNTGGAASSVEGTLKFLVAEGNTNSATLVERQKIRSTGQAFHFTDTSFIIRTVRTGSTNALLSLQNNSADIDSGTQVFRVLADGDVENNNNSYGALSDAKLKENIVDAGSQWEDLKAINVRNFNFKEELGFGTNTNIGVVAQELELVSPGLVKTSPDMDADENDLGTTTKSVKYSVLYMKAIKALQEAMGRIETLEQRLTDAGL